MFKERENYTLFVADSDLRVIEGESPSKVDQILETENVVVRLMKYENEERKEDLKTEASDSQTGGDAFYEIHDASKAAKGILTPVGSNRPTQSKH